MTHLLLVGAWPELAARLVGLPGRVTLLQLEGMPGGSDLTAYGRWAADLVTARWDQPAEILDIAAGLNRRDPLDVVAGYGEFALPAVAAISAQLGIRSVPGPVDQRPGKSVQRTLFAAGGCRPVRHLLCSRPDEVRAFVEAGPAVLKPDLGNGSLGVFAVDRTDQMEQGWRWVRGAGLGAVLAEERLSGPEFSVETRSVSGLHEALMVTEKFTSGPPHFVEIGHVMPARTDVDELKDEAVRALSALGHTDGPAHVELIRTDDGPKIVEVNRRLGGDRIWELLQLSTGIDVLRQVLLDALDPKPAAVGGDATAAAAIRFVHGSEAMFANGLPARPAEPIEAVEGLIRWRWEPTTYHRRLGYVLTYGADPTDAVGIAEQVCKAFPGYSPAGTV
ncbi:ATP-grasp domain-containing protein [Kribbella qitaiheensis]|uniref:ATP-grasp domain-containing protein n=1 Tax=Kribbella qitaiheensis TaxID=1544730 RepID=A0A7G6WTZ9_9ACTN|nr:ATP-grasp domain-containing protein [Kribbella qitaiheensis]QNE17464.1 ATP-grasp domain-containing protein [Kribbella qitaiheensis]